LPHSWLRANDHDIIATQRRTFGELICVRNSASGSEGCATGVYRGSRMKHIVLLIGEVGVAFGLPFFFFLLWRDRRKQLRRYEEGEEEDSPHA
jgi:hypothetical protein